MEKIDISAINTLRMLSADAVQKANSGHPGLPLGAAPAAYSVWAKEMKHNPCNPNWIDRDRFILSAGHGSALLYSLLHIFGYEVTIDDLKQFRQKGSLVPGHPEYKHTAGVEITTGPLGQGIANGVGMAWAENYIANKFNKPNYNIIDHYTFVLCGDGCLMEGISYEAASLAGTLGLSKLILIYDSNNITIEGDTQIAFNENVKARFEALGWHTQIVEDGNDVDKICNAVKAAKEELNKPSIIEVKTKIGFGSPNKSGKASAHGEPLGVEEIKATKLALGFDPEQHFFVPSEVKQEIGKWLATAQEKEAMWNDMIDGYKKEYPDNYSELMQWNSGKLSDNALNQLESDDFWTYEGNIATRISSEKVLNKVCKFIPNLIGGSADLSPSTKTVMQGRESYSKNNPSGSNLHFGIREHAMAAIANGMLAHGGLRPYIAGFFVFSDYMKPAMRLSALMKLPVINIMTHDSIGVGEDGPTHQPIEHLAALHSIPNFTVVRPCDSNETAAAWYLALTRPSSPTAIVLTRQNTMLLNETGKSALKGAYILKDSEKETPDIILMASGSEVELIYKAKSILLEKGIDARIVSMPSFEVFEEQTREYKESVLPASCRKRLAVEAASSFGWAKYVGLDGGTICIDTFGMSAPAGEIFREFGFTVENVVEKAMRIYNKQP